MGNQTRFVYKKVVLALGCIFVSMIAAVHAESYTTESTLSNGLKVIVREDHRSPTVAHMVWYKTGSIDETTGTTGVAHVLEHMMFKGTEKVGTGEFSKRVAAVGGRENAFTNNDYTAYFQQIEKSHLEEMMVLEADRMQNLQLSEAEFKKEIQVVMEERRLRTDDQATGLMYEQFMATAFNAAPNRHPVIGWMEDLKNMTYLDAQNWYHKWYTPSNAVLVVVGDVKPEEVLNMAQRTYGAIPKRQIEERKLQGEPEQKGIKRFTLKAPAENTLVFMGWKAPKVENGNMDVIDPWALEVLAGILDGNQNARLNRTLVIDKKISSGVGSSYEASGRGEQLFLIEGEMLPGKSPQLFEKEVKSILAKIAESGIQDQELQRVKIAVTAAQVYKRDSVFGQAMEIGANEMVGNSWKKIDLITEKIQAVTADQVKLVAKKYFTDDRLTVGILDPQPIDPAKKLANERAAAAIQR